MVFLPEDPPKGYLLFLHGSLMTPYHYTRYFRALAEAGYAVIAPSYNMHIFVDVGETVRKTERLMDSLRKVYRLGRGCVGGHSMGGYVAIRMAYRFDCLVLLSPYVPLGGSLDYIEKPTLLFSAGRDFLTPYTFHQKRVFQKVRADRALVLIEDATHNSYLDTPILGDLMAGWPPFNPPRHYETVADHTVRFMDSVLGN